MIMGSIESIGVAYTRTQKFILYESFHTVMIAIVVFLLFMKLFDEYQKNIASNNGRIDLGTYWVQIRMMVIVCFISTSSGMIFNLVEHVFIELQDNLINGMGGDIANKSLETMIEMVKQKVLIVDELEEQDMTKDIPFVTGWIFKCLSAIVMSVGVFLFKYTYTFFILGRYMWLLMLELVAPVAIVLMIHENTRSYFYNWLRNMLICYLLIPMFLLADKFSNEVANFFMEGKETAGQVTVLLVVCVGVWVKVKMFAIVRSKASQLI